jgi:hypothetical protein
MIFCGVNTWYLEMNCTKDGKHGDEAATIELSAAV